MSVSGSLENSWDDTVLLERCRELGLTEQEVGLLRDILGWNIRSNGRVPPVRYRDREALGALVTRLLDARHFPRIKSDPVAVLRDDLRLTVPAIAWVVLNCKLNVLDQEIQSQVDSLRYTAPEITWQNYALPVFHALLNPS